MTVIRARGARCLTVLVAAGLLGIGSAASAEDADPADFGEPSAEQIAESIHVWDPSGHVEPLEQETRDGAETVVTLDSDILFAFGSAEISPSAETRLSELVADLPTGTPVSVVGHTDNVGSDADNLALSQRRAQTVADVIAAARPDLVLEVEGRGESDPVASNAEAEGREANRRVEIRYGG